MHEHKQLSAVQPPLLLVAAIALVITSTVYTVSVLISSQRMLHQCIDTKQMPNVVQAQIQPLSKPWQRLQRSLPMMAMTAMHIWLMHWPHCRSMAMMKQKKSITVGAYLACLVTELAETRDTSSTSKICVTAYICPSPLN
jgi:hypothetical protein